MNSEQRAAYELIRDIGELTGEIKALRAENARLVSQNQTLLTALTPCICDNCGKTLRDHHQPLMTCFPMQRDSKP